MSNIQINHGPTCTCWPHFSSLNIMHARTHMFTVGISPFLNLPSGSCLWLILKLPKKNKYSSNSSQSPRLACGRECVSAAHTLTHTPLQLNTPDTVLTPFPVQLVPFFPVFLFPSHLNLSPYILLSVLLNHFLIASANQFSKLFQLIQHFLLFTKRTRI